jgi:hypothetical protein
MKTQVSRSKKGIEIKVIFEDEEEQREHQGQQTRLQVSDRLINNQVLDSIMLLFSWLPKKQYCLLYLKLEKYKIDASIETLVHLLNSPHLNK